ncbi:Membrane magnesium transporter 1 [Podila verticillata]|nr:Membrane magnesium transporter 1 [Podila verticillata]
MLAGCVAQGTQHQRRTQLSRLQYKSKGQGQEDLSYLKAIDGHESGLPQDIVIELMASVAIFGLGIVMVADDFKEILMETEMAKQTIESLDARPSFYGFNHRGRAVFRNVSFKK